MSKKYFFILFAILLNVQQLSFSQTNSTKKYTIELSKKEFLQKVVNYEKEPAKWLYVGEKPCVIDFYATWCGPCKILAPVLKEIAKEYQGTLYIYKVDVDKEPELAAKFGIRSYPSLIFCPMTGNPHLAKGALPKENLVAIIQQVLFPNK
jgi:thioredoxin